MAISELSVVGYRSVRQISLKLKQINVLVGPNGCGKTNLYRSMFLLHAAASGQLARTIVDEGGMPSVLWAGARKKGQPVRMRLGVIVDQLSYELSCGLPTPDPSIGPSRTYPCGGSMFKLDPEVKEEQIRFQSGGRRIPLLDRGNSTVWARDADGQRITYPMVLSESESVLAQLREPHRFPQLSALRQEILNWRFYHHFRTDPDAAIRHPQIGIRTTVLSHDGRDLAAALRTIIEIGDEPGLREAIDHAFPGAELTVEAPQARFALELQMPEFKRPFAAQELSDGTLRYLCLLAALMSPRPPSMLALNEPETSIHPDLIEPLARLIVRASRDSQLWITTHSEALAGAIEGLSGAKPIRLEKVEGETRVVGQRIIEGEE
jgi:predicted ATPase